MRDLHRHARLLTDADDFLHGLGKPAILAAQVTDVPPALAGRQLGKAQYFREACMQARLLFQTRGQSQRTCFHIRMEQFLHG